MEQKEKNNVPVPSVNTQLVVATVITGLFMRQTSRYLRTIIENQKHLFDYLEEMHKDGLTMKEIISLSALAINDSKSPS